MLNQITLEQSMPLALKLAEQKKVLGAVVDTPLSAILGACSTYGLHTAGTDLNEISLTQATQHLIESAGLRDGIADHSAVVNQYVELAGQSVAQSLNFVRNIVLPDVKEALTTIEEYRQGVANSSLLPFEIKPVMRDQVFSNPLLLELVERYSDTPAREVPRRQLPTLDLQRVKDLAKSGAADFDAEVALVLSADGDAGYIAIQRVLAGTEFPEAINAKYAVGLHLACKALFNEPTEGTEMGLTEYNTHISQLTEQSGRVTYQLIEEYRRRDRLGQLYLGGVAFPEGNVPEIRVDNEVYLKMLDQGLTPEALLGNEMTGRSYSQSQLVENVEVLTNYYAREMKLRQMRNHLEENNRIREGVYRIMSTMVVNKPEEDLPAPRATLHQRAADYCNLISDRDLECLPVFVRNMVCHVFYAHTDARLVLEIMDGLGEKYPETAPRELALLTTIQYVSYWVSKQIEVS